MHIDKESAEDKKEVKNEIDFIKCNECGKIKKRIKIGKYKSNENIYQDENGRKWSGKRCPTCHVINMRRFRRRDKFGIKEDYAKQIKKVYNTEDLLNLIEERKKKH